MKVIKSLENGGNLLNITTSKTTSQEGGFFIFLKSLISAVLPLMKTVFTPLTKSVLLPLGSTAGIAATDAAIQKKIMESATTALMISNEETQIIIKTVKSLEESDLLVKGVDETIENESKTDFFL